ncbi:hypothetical protein AHAT_22980 [Agarivorans sp. Toyoura001]|nr:hypothetical protein AHAT_22980 [Agarivorans sp. Toyoura001]
MKRLCSKRYIHPIEYGNQDLTNVVTWVYSKYSVNAKNRDDRRKVDKFDQLFTDNIELNFYAMV